MPHRVGRGERSLKTHGRLWLQGDVWFLQCSPHVAMYAKRIFNKIAPDASGTLYLKDAPSVCRDLEWFTQRFPLDCPHMDRLTAAAHGYREHIASMDEILGEYHVPREFKLAVPARDYQRRAAELWVASGSLLLADDVGLGKTCSAIAALTEPNLLPAVVVCMPHLARQWEREINRFAPNLRTHIIKSTKVYELASRNGSRPDVLIISYYKLASWVSVLGKACSSVIFDESQELRRASGSRGEPTQKYGASKAIADQMQYRLGLSATPIYNYGGEFFNVLEVLAPGSLGERSEFHQEWCSGHDQKARIKDPEAFGAWLRENHLMLRRTRRDVGRELSPLSKIMHTVDSDTGVLDRITSQAGELARIILAQGESQRGDKYSASQEFNNLLRQHTGIAKAPYVAEFVKLLLDNGEPVVLYGWHRACYEIWRDKLKDYHPVLYTGSESPAAKQAACDAFIRGEAQVLMVSLRSGAGLDGLQQRCRTVVFGELDWSPSVIEQCIGRIYRDGQTDPVTAYFLVSEDGADPLMQEVLGLKREQLDGVRGVHEILQRVDSGQAVKQLAEQWLKRKRR